MATRVSKNLISSVSVSAVSVPYASGGDILVYNGSTGLVEPKHPADVLASAGIDSISAFATHRRSQQTAAFITTAGKLAGWGFEDTYRRSTTADTVFPTFFNFLDANDNDYLVENNVKVTQCVMSRYNSIALLSDGTVWVNGYNAGGRLGFSTGTYPLYSSYTSCFRQIPAASVSNRTFKKVTLFAEYNINVCAFAAVTTDGRLYLWGYNLSRHRGDGSADQSVAASPVEITGFGTNVQDVELYGSGYSGSPNVYTITSAVLKTDGTLWCCGYNAYGQQGQGNTTATTTFVQAKVSAGSYLTGVTNLVRGGGNVYSNIFVIAGGQVWGAGDNSFHQLDSGTTDSSYFKQITSSSSPIIDALACGGISYSVSLMALATDGSVINWGGNSSGQLGDGTTTSRTLSTVALSATSIFGCMGGNANTALGFIKSGKVYMAGDAVPGGVYLAGANLTRYKPLANITDAKSVVIVESSSATVGGVAVLTNSGKIYTSGYNQYNFVNGTSTSEYMGSAILRFTTM